MAWKFLQVPAAGTKQIQGDIWGWVPLSAPSGTASWTGANFPLAYPLINHRFVAQDAVTDPTFAAGTSLLVLLVADTPGDAATLPDAANYPSPSTVSIAGSVAVTGTFFQATQPVSVAATVTTVTAGFTGTDPTLISNVGPAASVAMGATSLATPFKWIHAFLILVTGALFSTGVELDFTIAALTFKRNTPAIPAAGIFYFTISWGWDGSADIVLPGPPPASANITIPAQGGLTSAQLISYKGF